MTLHSWKFHSRRLLAILALGGCSAVSHAVDFSFSQSGYDEGATISGTFSGEDLNSDGILSFFALDGPAELTDFSLSFSGNALVEAFTFDFANLDYFVYYLGDNLLGNDVSEDLTSLDFEGIGAFGTDFLYTTGQGPTFTDGGFVYGPDALTETPNLVQVSPAAAVPDSGSAALLLSLGLAGLLFARRSRD